MKRQIILLLSICSIILSACANKQSQEKDILNDIGANPNFAFTKMKALEGMETIASVQSLPEIKKYCQKLDPIMWDYKEPDQELVDAADRIYTAITSNLAKED